MPFIYVYSPSDFVATPPDEAGAQADGSPTFTLTLAPGATPTLIEITDDDAVFDEIDASQVLANTYNVDGTTYTAGTTIHSAYDLINTSTGHKVTSLHFGGDGYQQGAIHGIASTVPLTPGTTYTFDSERTSHQQDNKYTDFVACFTDGTYIETPHGPRLIEEFEEGDLVQTLDHGAQPLRHILRRSVPAKGNFAPIVLPKGICGNARELVVSPQHRMLFSGPRCELLFGTDEVLVSATQLEKAGLATCRQGGEVTYYHLVFDQHEIIFAEGAATESFLPTDMANLPPEMISEFNLLFPGAHAAFAPQKAARTCLRPHETQLLLAA